MKHVSFSFGLKAEYKANYELLFYQVKAKKKRIQGKKLRI